MYIVINGGGKVGEYLATVLLRSGNEVSIIERDTAVADRLSMVLEGRYLVIRGDGCDSRYQEDAGIRKADVFVAATGQDDNNLVSCEIASRVYGVHRCIARVNAPKNQRIFRALGIESISSTEMIANLIEEETLMGSVNVVSSLTHGDVVLTEMAVPHMTNHSNDDGVLAYDVEMPENSLIVAISTKDDVQVVNEDSRLFPGDTVVIVADREQVARVREAFRAL
ncbi:MAG: TrkA family potassium uptake protein [Coriobacteriaceae bacterium]|jgi:trk system potassium uptake protein TrkA|nr:TrkA family potassium uptake protein [Coriobacteriaceae bacterium]